MDSGDDAFAGKINTMVQVICLILLILMPLLSLALHMIEKNQ